MLKPSFIKSSMEDISQNRTQKNRDLRGNSLGIQGRPPLGLGVFLEIHLDNVLNSIFRGQIPIAASQALNVSSILIIRS